MAEKEAKKKNTEKKPKETTRRGRSPQKTEKAPIVVTAEWKNAPTTPQKARLVADLVRGMNAVESLDVLAMTQKKAAGIIRKVVRSAIANAEHNTDANKDAMVIARIFVGDGLKFRRYRAVSRGRAHGFVRRRSHILVELKEK